MWLSAGRRLQQLCYWPCSNVEQLLSGRPCRRQCKQLFLLPLTVPMYVQRLGDWRVYSVSHRYSYDCVQWSVHSCLVDEPKNSCANTVPLPSNTGHGKCTNASITRIHNNVTNKTTLEGSCQCDPYWVTDMFNSSPTFGYICRFGTRLQFRR